MNMKQFADRITASTPIFRKGGKRAELAAELLHEQAEQQRQRVEAIAQRVDAVAASVRSIQDDLAELLQ